MNRPTSSLEEQAKERREELTIQVKAAQSGDKAGFESLVRLTEDHARKLAYSVVGPSHCDDVLQESYLLVFRKIAQVKKPEAFVSWLCRLVMHVAYRHKKKHPAMEELPEKLGHQDQTTAVVESLVLRSALNRLKKSDKELLVLRELLSLSYDDIARVLEVPVGTVRSRLHKARARLSDSLSETQA